MCADQQHPTATFGTPSQKKSHELVSGSIVVIKFIIIKFIKHHWGRTRFSSVAMEPLTLTKEPVVEKDAMEESTDFYRNSAWNSINNLECWLSWLGWLTWLLCCVKVVWLVNLWKVIRRFWGFETAKVVWLKSCPALLVWVQKSNGQLDCMLHQQLQVWKMVWSQSQSKSQPKRSWKIFPCVPDRTVPTAQHASVLDRCGHMWIPTPEWRRNEVRYLHLKKWATISKNVFPDFPGSRRAFARQAHRRRPPRCSHWAAPTPRATGAARSSTAGARVAAGAAGATPGGTRRDRGAGHCRTANLLKSEILRKLMQGWTNEAIWKILNISKVQTPFGTVFPCFSRAGIHEAAAAFGHTHAPSADGRTPGSADPAGTTFAAGCRSPEDHLLCAWQPAGSLLAACWWLVFHSWIDLTGCRFEAGLHAMSNTRAWQEQTRNLSGSDLPGYSLRDLGKRMRRIPAFWQVICFVLENREMCTFRLSRLYETWHTYATAWLKRCLCSSSFQSASWSQMQQTRDSYFAPHLFPHFPPFPSPSILQHGTDGCSVGGGPGCFACDNCSLCGTACEVRPTCWEPRPSKFWRFFTCKSLIVNSLLSHALWIHTRPSVERRRVLPRKILSSSSGRTVSGSKLTLHAGKNMGRRSLLQQVCQISASLPDVESVWSI